MSVEKLVLPGGSVFGGAPSFSMKGRDGAVYVVYCGERPGKKFGTHAFRVLPNGTREWVELPAFTEGRVGVTVEADGAYLTWPVDRDTAELRVKLPGFVPMDFDGTLPPPVQPQPVPTPPAPVNAVDEEGRAYTNAVKKELKGDVAKLDARLKAVEARPAGGAGGVSEAQARDIAWSLAPSAVYADLQRADSGIRKVIGEIAAGQTAGIDRAALKALVREVLLELLAE